MAYAVIKTGGKQYRVQQGTKFDVEKLDGAVDSEITFDALLVGEGETVTGILEMFSELSQPCEFEVWVQLEFLFSTGRLCLDPSSVH